MASGDDSWHWGGGGEMGPGACRLADGFDLGLQRIGWKKEEWRLTNVFEVNNVVDVGAIYWYKESYYEHF